MSGKATFPPEAEIRARRIGFSLVELLVALAVFAILLSILIPAVMNARQRAESSECVSNLRQIGSLVQLYVNENNGKLPFSTTPGATGGAWIWDSYGGGVISEPSPHAGFPRGGVLTTMAGYHEGGIMAREDYEAAGAKHIFNCPSNNCDDPRFDHVGYIANRNLMVTHHDGDPVRIVQVEDPAKLILLADNNVDGPDADLNRWYFGENNWDTRIGFHRHGGAHCLFLDGSVRLMNREEVDPAVHIEIE